MKISFYTVALEKPGYLIYFMCPNCPNVHCYPENPDEAKFGDPADSIEEFKISGWGEAAEWIFLMPALFILLIEEATHGR